MPNDTNLRLKLDTVLVATDFSPTSKRAMAYAALSIARRHGAKLLIGHVVNSHSERAVMDGWRAGQVEVTESYLAGQLDGIEHQLLVKSGDVWPALARVVSEYGVDLVVVGTHGRAGLRKLVLGSVAENIFHQSRCPVLTVGPNTAELDPQIGPERILTSTGFAPQLLLAVGYAVLLAKELHASLGLLHVVDRIENAEKRERLRRERAARLRALVPGDVRLAAPPCFVVEFGSATEKILVAASAWKANLIVLGLRHVEESSRGESTWAKAYKIVRQANCPVMTIRLPA